jgi:2,4-diketo-3-deoxy-L-fuconate hydrolase
MRLLRIGPAGQERPFILLGNEMIVDVSARVRDFDATFFGEGGLAPLADLIGDGPDDAMPVLPGERIGPPIARPGKIVCIGLNYADHAVESNAEPPAEPVVFFKAPNTVIGPNDDVLIPIAGHKTDWEVELGVVIGRPARYLPSIEAADVCVAGYVVSNDVSERAFQLERGGQWVKGKSCETFNPLGPWLVTADEVENPQALRLWLDVNGERMQESSTEQMVFGVHHLIWYLSQFMVLEPGDLINTGTPAGVGLGMDPPRFLRPGDVMELGIERLGVQRQTCQQAVAANDPGAQAQPLAATPG